MPKLKHFLAVLFPHTQLRILGYHRLVRDLNLPVLAERGFACEIDSSNADHVRVRIWRAPSH